ncbi:DUF3152 domain-containing protein [Propionibacterium australiense]|uniref:DUF3152 domain-containing protein n=1 Tax=Propionibacterium australiense TaxID=119981 RepID=A0A8B3FJW9_9ACTN|nr:DUF3152 domain-containing protein [Propionibacterium australiense]RLP10792.1 DUF3152 domain-containing protein [Propionibacterium australiense]
MTSPSEPRRRDEGRPERSAPGRATGLVGSLRAQWSRRPWYRAVLLAVALVLVVVLVLVRCAGRGADPHAPDATGSNSAGRNPSAVPSISVGSSEAPLPAAVTGNPTTATVIINGVTLKATRDDRGYWHSNIASTGQWRIAGLDVEPAKQTATVHTYAVQVEEGLPLDVDATATQISSILNDERGWTGFQENSFQLVSDPARADFTIYVGSAGTVDELCWPDDTEGLVDCRNGDRIALNIDRWLFAAPPYEGQTVDAYRTYLVNHEVGHYIGFGHVPCPGEGRPSPIMVQQTIDLQGCVPAWWPAEVGYT